MNFFKEQEIARRNSFLLVVLFILSISILIVVSNIAVSFILSAYLTRSFDNYQNYLNLNVFLSVSIPLFLCMFTLTFFKLKEFRDTKKILSHYFNATRVRKYSSSHKKRVLLNVVEEMSIASGIPSVTVYSVSDSGINSFVIGNSHEDAIIVVSTAAIEQLSRDELQAMVAHEFAKIFSRDMNLNVNLTALTYSLLSISRWGDLIIKYFIYGEENKSSKNNENNRVRFSHPFVVYFMLLVGLFLYIFGFVGYVLAFLIKFFIMKQRMYLIDALSIEYIRNPEALIRVLKKSTLHKSYLVHYDLFEHAYFVQSDNTIFDKFFSLYPDVKHRILRLQQSGIFIFKERERYKNTKEVKEEKKEKIDKNKIGTVITGFLMLDNFEKVQSYGELINKKSDSLPLNIKEVFESIESTKALIISLLLSKDLMQRENQIALLKENRELQTLVLNSLEKIESLDDEFNLMIFYYSLPILKEMDIDSYRIYRNILNGIAHFDGIIDIFEWNIQTIIIKQLDKHFSLSNKIVQKYTKYEELTYPLEIFLSFIAHSQESKVIQANICFEKTVNSQKFNNLNLISKKDITSKILKESIKHLEQCSIDLKKRIIESCVFCICFDEVVENWEIELIYSISILFEIPLPLFNKDDFIKNI